MTFKELLKLVRVSNGQVGICNDSRKVKPGDCFVAIVGDKLDGHDFIDNALTNGAAYIVSEKPVACQNAEVITVPDATLSLAQLAQAHFSEPSARLVNLAVTGTNGKTTVAFLVRSVIRAAGKEAGLIGTIFYDTSKEATEASLTTPDSIQIAEMAHKMAQAGAQYMVIEASSHALDQNRLAAINFTAAAFTNLTGDHLDYHKTAENYLAAKTKLFSGLDANATAVLNAQSPESSRIAEKTKKAKILYYAVDKQADIAAHIESMDVNQTVYHLCFGEKEQIVKTTLIGKHNISNHLAAAGLCIAAGFELDVIAAGLSDLKCVPGRLEPVDCGRVFAVLIDYAHTDDALSNVLDTLKPLCKGNLTVVFGCGGDRDKTKRPRMAKAAEQKADTIIVTSDNPRTEDAMEIIKDILTGFTEKRLENISVEADRKKAIELAMKTARKDDIILIAGKGHETYQIIGEKKFDFNDAEIVCDFLKKNQCSH